MRFTLININITNIEPSNIDGIIVRKTFIFYFIKNTLYISNSFLVV